MARAKRNPRTGRFVKATVRNARRVVRRIRRKRRR